MKYPGFIEIGDKIGVTAPSAGITNKDDLIRLNNVKNNINKLGFDYIETDNVRTCIKGRSSSAKTRADQFMQLWNNEDVKVIITATGGDFLVEILEYLDFNQIKNSTPKWIHGYSNITTLSYVFTTLLDIATIYGSNIKAYGMEKLYRNLADSIKIMQGKEIVQESFELCEEFKQERKNPLEGYNLTKKTCWKSLNSEEKLKFSGRSIGGCFDDIVNIIGTKYDNTKQYIEKYKDDGIIWFLEVYEMNVTNIYLHLLQMKNAGYFENCNGILFGRPLFIKDSKYMNYKEALQEALKDLNLPVIYDVDIGHIAPQMSIVNGAILEVEYQNNKGSIKTIFK